MTSHGPGDYEIDHLISRGTRLVHSGEPFASDARTLQAIDPASCSTRRKPDGRQHRTPIFFDALERCYQFEPFMFSRYAYGSGFDARQAPQKTGWRLRHILLNCQWRSDFQGARTPQTTSPLLAERYRRPSDRLVCELGAIKYHCKIVYQFKFIEGQGSRPRRNSIDHITL